jgi:glycosyltransferase involved in cell wall biosynthesis
MACGLPVIATKCGGPEEIITKETGILVERENPQDLARAIRIVSENPGSYQRDVIRNYAREKYGPETFVKSISEVYQELLRNTK